MTKMQIAPEFSRIIKIDNIEKTHKNFSLEANPQECEALAKRFNLRGLTYLKAEVELWRNSRSSIIYFKGTFMAKATQECVVTCAPVEADISEEFHEKFRLAGQGDDDDPEMEDAEELHGDVFDMAEIVAQYFFLSLNPYPRAAEAP